MTVTSASDGDRRVRPGDVIAKESTTIEVPVREIDTLESIACGMRIDMLTIGEGEVATGSGLGTDWIHLRWGDRKAVVRGSELLKAWVASFAPGDAARFPDGIR